MIEKMHVINGVGPKNKLLVFLGGFLVKKKKKLYHSHSNDAKFQNKI